MPQPLHFLSSFYLLPYHSSTTKLNTNGQHRRNTKPSVGTTETTSTSSLQSQEVFGSNKALWFSPSGNKLAFGYFDDSHTPIITIPFYGYPGNRMFQYTSTISIHYPKSGTTNPTVKLFYVDLEEVVQGSVSLTEIEHPTELSSEMRILSAVAFPTDTLVYATWMNRVQNRAYFHFCYVHDPLPKCTTVRTYPSIHTDVAFVHVVVSEPGGEPLALKHFENHGWVEQFEPPMFSDDGDSFLTILPEKQHDDSYWRHAVAITNVSSDKPRRIALTSGRFVVTELVSWDQKNSYLLDYYANWRALREHTRLFGTGLLLGTCRVDIQTPTSISCTPLSTANENLNKILNCMTMSNFNFSRCLYPTMHKYLSKSYYLATTKEESAVQHLYRISTRTTDDRKPRCLSCGIVRETDRNRCLYNTAKFSTDHSNYVLTCAGPGVPDIAIYNRVSVARYRRLVIPLQTTTPSASLHSAHCRYLFWENRFPGTDGEEYNSLSFRELAKFISLRGKALYITLRPIRPVSLPSADSGLALHASGMCGTEAKGTRLLRLTPSFEALQIHTSTLLAAYSDIVWRDGAFVSIDKNEEKEEAEMEEEEETEDSTARLVEAARLQPIIGFPRGQTPPRPSEGLISFPSRKPANGKCPVLAACRRTMAAEGPGNTLFGDFGWERSAFAISERYLAYFCTHPPLQDSVKLLAWENNDAVSEIIAEKSQPVVHRYKVDVSGGFKARVRLLIPPNADLSGVTKYPMLIFVYGGPDSYQVTEKFNVDWGTYLVTNKSIIYATIDGRGSGLMDNSMLFAGYRNLGTVEIADQINVTSLCPSFPSRDEARYTFTRDGLPLSGYNGGVANNVERGDVENRSAQKSQPVRMLNDDRIEENNAEGARGPVDGAKGTRRYTNDPMRSRTWSNLGAKWQTLKTEFDVHNKRYGQGQLMGQKVHAGNNRYWPKTVVKVIDDDPVIDGVLAVLIRIIPYDLRHCLQPIAVVACDQGSVSGPKTVTKVIGDDPVIDGVLSMLIRIIPYDLRPIAVISYDQGSVNGVNQSYLQDSLPFIDRSRTAIWGWSYGGYATGMTLAMDYQGVFKCGMSVAPVTDWALYGNKWGLSTDRRLRENAVGKVRVEVSNKAMRLNKG
ncbi:Venom dipeptidyl peptidase 4 [Eufriesea mexicana]|nr:Venom dipeptidyl peptidase 4 [Eufriesea mexicana]